MSGTKRNACQPIMARERLSYMKTPSAPLPPSDMSKKRPWWIVSAAALAVIFLATAIASTADAQGTYKRPADYNFFADFEYTFAGNDQIAPKNWNIYGGAMGLPYYIHVDVIAAGFEPAVRRAFQTMEDDPGSDVSFVYKGSTTVLSEIRIVNGLCCPQPSDNFNVVSFGNLPQGSGSTLNDLGRGGLGGFFDQDPFTGAPLGTGDGRFDITLANGETFVDGAQSGAFDVESLVLHELGHALGLAHPTLNEATVMWGILDSGTMRRNLHPADRAGLAELYPSSTVVQPTLCNGQNPTLFASAGVPLVGTSGNDVILGSSGADIIDAGSGNDTICALGGSDQVVGGDGDDTILGGDGADFLRGGPGIDLIDGGSGNDRLLGGVDGDTITGGDGDDFIGGFGGDDIIDGGAGNEKIFGGFGHDLIDGGSGNDEIHGLVGNDIITGGPGNDSLDGERGNDTISGGAGDDVIRGGNADDTLNGDSGDDEVRGGRADDSIRGGTGTDICVGNDQKIADTAFTDCETSFGFP